ncbi:flagellar motor protein MotB [Hydrogenophilus thiooxidans]|uniref:flagellar motor protein MotB n=1 Tax=Hydrogenophilus thiooxidans TaxID=2820326 RepID=UPI001C226FEF|nr:flagellar motor protein MotB [Hydrogenophilus thiooxidans]
MSDDTQQPIIVKRIKKVSGGAHGGAWKIAYADFVTAMMAFFLLMWLLGSTAKGDLDGIAQFFQNPLKVARDGGSGSGDAERIIPGGGEDLSRRIGQVKRGDTPSKSTFQRDGGDGSLPTKGRSDSKNDSQDMQRVQGATSDAEAQEQENQKRREIAQMERVRSLLEAMIEADSTLRALRDQIRMQITEDGLAIEIVDEKNRPMFASGSSQVQPYMRDLLRLIGRTLSGIENKIMIAGHTDATPFANNGRGISNWELSADRANAARRELVAGGLDLEKVFRVVGMADTVPFVPEDPYAPQNRRISIIVLKREAEEDLRKQASQITETLRRGVTRE